MRARQQRRLDAKTMQSSRSLTLPSLCKQKQNREIQKKRVGANPSTKSFMVHANTKKIKKKTLKRNGIKSKRKKH